MAGFEKGHKINLGRKRPDMIKNKINLGRIPWNKGKSGIRTGPLGKHWKISKEGMKNHIGFKLGDKITLGRKHSLETKIKMRNSHIGDKSVNWIKDRTKLKDDRLDRGGQLHREWSRSVKNRDSWKCKINDNDCKGKVIAHHILSWAIYPELRYKINNGITLCLAHHPRKRAEEKRLIPFFKELVSVSN